MYARKIYDACGPLWIDAGISLLNYFPTEM